MKKRDARWAFLVRASITACFSLAAFGQGCSSEPPLFETGGGGTTATTTPAGGGGAGGGLLCVPGHQIACACPGGAQGVQVCRSDGSGYGACECGSTGGAGGVGGAGGGPVCKPGTVIDCYAGPPDTQGVGLCVAGKQTCDADGSAFGPCSGEVLPEPETCATPGDDDCDGAANEDGLDCACAPGTQEGCYSGPLSTLNVGPCTGGVQQCNAAGTGYGPCVGEVTPLPETCNTPVDDDCDGATNEEGAGCVCTPGMQEACYTGPAGTQGIGECKGGMWQCNVSGTAWGPCTGETTPGQDLCITPADEDCNGAPVPCQGALTWSKIFPTVGSDQWGDIAVDGAGNVILAVHLGASFDFGGGLVAQRAIVKLDAQGNHVWSKGLIGGSPRSVAVDAGGDVVVSGIFSGTLDFGGGGVLMSQNDSNDGFVVKLSAAGQHVWSKRLGGSGGDEGRSVAVDADGNVIVAGSIGGAADLGGGVLPYAGGEDFFVVKLDAMGAHVWSKTFGDSGSQNVLHVAVDAAKNVVLAGRLSDAVDFGGGALVANGLDVFVAKLDSAGAHLWSKRFGGPQGQHCEGVAVDSAGNVLLTGYFEQSIDFGAGPLVAPADAFDGYLTKLSSSGALVWAKHLTGAGQQIPQGVAVGLGDTVLVTGRYTTTLDFGAGALVSAGQGDLFLARLSSTGTQVWAKTFGDGNDQSGSLVAVDLVDAVVVGGFTASGQIDFGDGPLTTPNAGDLVVAKLAP